MVRESRYRPMSDIEETYEDKYSLHTKWTPIPMGKSGMGTKDVFRATNSW